LRFIKKKKNKLTGKPFFDADETFNFGDYSEIFDKNLNSDENFYFSEIQKNDLKNFKKNCGLIIDNINKK
jgi:hypothetical protein